MPYLPDVSQHPVYEPNGTIKIYHDVPLDSSYTHTFNSSIGDLATAISGYSKYTLTAQSYSRLTEGSVRVQLFKGDLISCNYMQITNGINGENFPYWCFITDVEYVNNTTSDIFFEIDYLQTFWHRFTIPANFIEREHCLVSEDVAGKNLIPEGLDLGDYIINNYKHDNDYETGKHIVVLYVPNLPAGEGATPYLEPDGSVTGVLPNDFYHCNDRNGFGKTPALVVLSNTANLNVAIGNLINAHNTIVAIYQIGNEMYTDNFVENSYWGHSNYFDEGTTFKRTDGTLYDNVRNKKLFNYPYRQLVVSNNNGQNAEFKWELFDSNYQGNKRALFKRGNVMLPTPVSFVYPEYYRGKVADYENRIVIDDFPQVNWSEDSFSKWWAQNKANLGLSLATTALSTGFMVMGGGLGAGAVSAGVSEDFGASALQGMVNARLAGDPKSAGRFKSLATQAFENENAGNSRNMGMGRMGRMALGYGAQSIAKTLGQVQIAKVTPDNANIQKNNSLANVLVGNFGFTYYDMGISGEMAEIIDRYFDMFGYATHKVKIPNFTTSQTARPAYDYIKMQNCFILAQTGDRGLPEVAQNAIQAIFNNGITIWRTLSQIGNYNVTNR